MELSSSAQVRHLAALARLSLSEKEAETFPKEFASVLELISVLDRVSSETVLPLTTISGVSSVLREDVVQDSSVSDELVGQHPDADGRKLRVPAVFSL